jgi:hypothetical protein
MNEAPRSGNETDEPEGTRLIQMSDTLACQTSCRLVGIANLIDALRVAATSAKEAES